MITPEEWRERPKVRIRIRDTCVPDRCVGDTVEAVRSGLRRSFVSWYVLAASGMVRDVWGFEAEEVD